MRNRKKALGKLLAVVTDQFPLLEIGVPAMDCQFVVRRLPAVSNPNPREGKGQVRMALPLVGAIRKLTPLTGSPKQWPCHNIAGINKSAFRSNDFTNVGDAKGFVAFAPLNPLQVLGCYLAI